MDTNDLVARLAANAAPVRRLASPALRVVMWLAISAPVVAAVMMSLGMMLLSPISISLPLKLALFVLVNGWTLVVGSLAQGFVR